MRQFGQFFVAGPCLMRLSDLRSAVSGHASADAAHGRRNPATGTSSSRNRKNAAMQVTVVAESRRDSDGFFTVSSCDQHAQGQLLAAVGRDRRDGPR